MLADFCRRGAGDRGVCPQVAVPAAETSPAPISGIAPSYGPKTVSAVPNAAAIVRRIWLPGLDAGYDPQGLAVDGGGIYVSAYRSDSFGVRRGPCRVIHIDLETGDPTGYVDVPSPCGHAGGLAAHVNRFRLGSVEKLRRDQVKDAWGRDERFVLQLEPEGLAIFISLVAVLTAAVAGRVGRRSGT